MHSVHIILHTSSSPSDGMYYYQRDKSLHGVHLLIAQDILAAESPLS
jgi:hypothetical protein